MIPRAYQKAALIDTSAVLALHSPTDRWHSAALAAYAANRGLTWIVLNETSHETYTRARYDLGFRSAEEQYRFLRERDLTVIAFEAADETKAFDVLSRYHEHPLSFHDALCAAIMIRLGVYRVFAFDKHFTTLGFEVFPARLAC